MNETTQPRSDQNSAPDQPTWSFDSVIITLDQHNRIRYVNAAAEALIGKTWEQVQGHPLEETLTVTDAADRQNMARAIADCLQGRIRKEQSIERLRIRCGNQERVIKLFIGPIDDRDGQPIGTQLSLDDVTAQHDLAEKLSYHTRHDALTGLFNRDSFEHCVRQALQNATKGLRTYALSYLEVDQYKTINDSCGVAAADRLLQFVAGQLRTQVSASSILARVGENKFGMLLEGCAPDEATIVNERISRSFRNVPFQWLGDKFRITVGIGVVPIHGHSSEMQEVLSAAEIGCRLAQDAGSRRVRVCEPGTEEFLRWREQMRWVSRISKSVEEDRFRLNCQPIIPIGHGDRGQHFEVLISAIDDANQSVSAGVFIPVAESYGLMPAIDRWVIKTTLQAIEGTSRDRRPGSMVYAINLSGKSVADDELFEFILDQLKEHRVPPQSICFEFTETTAIADMHRAAEFAREIKRVGCELALDDFGSGFASFDYLRKIPVDYLKIDGSFVRDMLNDPIDHAMVKAINQVGHDVGLRTIAEFVESREILAALSEMSVDFAQGYGIGMPRPIAETLGGNKTISD